MTTTRTTEAGYRWPHWPAGLWETNRGYEIRTEITRAVMEQCLSAVGRAESPKLLWDAWWFGRVELTVPPMLGIVAQTWSGATDPTRSICRGEWVAMLKREGYTIDGQPAERPTEAVRLYRGCYPESIPLDETGRRVDVDGNGDPIDPDAEICEYLDSRLGLSWTTSITEARRYARGRPGQIGCVLVADVPADYLLAQISDEYLIDPLGLGCNASRVKVQEVCLDQL